MKKILKFLGEVGVWRAWGRLHTGIYHATGGRLGGSMAGLPHLLLTTTGRKSGQERTVALSYMPDGEHFVLVASNGGSDRHPAWWLNLRDCNRASAQVGSVCHAVVAERAEGEEYQRLWPLLKAFNPFYVQYEQITDRAIPVVVLRRTD